MAVSAAYAQLAGHFAFVVAHRDHPDQLVGTRHQCPLIAGIGDGETFLASSITAFSDATRRVVYLEDGEIVAATGDSIRVRGADGRMSERDGVLVPWDDEIASKRGYESFMLKEIHEQPHAVGETITRNLCDGALGLERVGDLDPVRRPARAHPRLRNRVPRGAGRQLPVRGVGRRAVRRRSRQRVALPPPADRGRRRSSSASRSRERPPTRSPALRQARAVRRADRGRHQLARVTDHARSRRRPIHARRDRDRRRSDEDLHRPGDAADPVRAAARRSCGGRSARSSAQALMIELRSLPQKIISTLERHADVVEIAERHADKPYFFFLGRHVGLPVCLEGALKLKEISYIPTEAYAAGEMKHGPIALIDDQTPVVCVATDSHVAEKLASNLQESAPAPRR